MPLHSVCTHFNLFWLIWYRRRSIMGWHTSTPALGDANPSDPTAPERFSICSPEWMQFLCTSTWECSFFILWYLQKNLCPWKIFFWLDIYRELKIVSPFALQFNESLKKLKRGERIRGTQLWMISQGQQLEWDENGGGGEGAVNHLNHKGCFGNVNWIQGKSILGGIIRFLVAVECLKHCVLL